MRGIAVLCSVRAFPRLEGFFSLSWASMGHASPLTGNESPLFQGGTTGGSPVTASMVDSRAR